MNATWNSWATARHLNSVMSGIATSEHSAAILPACEIYEPLRFDDICGRNAVVINNGQAAFRPNSSEQFENAIVFTNRPLNDGEIFQVEIVRSIDKWAGSLEIGLLAIKPPNSDSVPSTIMKFSSGCWYLMGEKVMLNGNVVKEQYGRRHLERLHKGDRIGVVRRAEGSLHFLINGEDQGVAAVGIPSGLYGVVDLYGQVVQIALVDMEIEETSAALFGPQISNCVSVTSEMRFLRSRHGVNVVVGADGSNAVRLEAEDEFNNAVVMSDRVLKRDELIQLKVDRIITRWSGSLEIGLTTTEPAKYRIPVTLSESDDNLWLLCGSSFLVQNGSNSSESEANGIEYSLNLNLVEQGDVVGLKIHQNGQLHFYLNGVDQGVACEMPDVEVLLLVDLYGQCVEVTLLPPTFVVEVSPVIIEAESESLFDEAFVACVDLLEIPHELSTCVSSGICLEMENQLARRTRSDAKSIVWSKESIREGEEFEIKLESVKESPRNGHSFKIGFLLAKDFPTQKDVLSWNRLSKGIWGQFFFISGHSLFVDTINLGENFCPCLNLLPVGSKVGCAVRKGGFVHFTLNGSDFGFICNGSSVYCVVELAGRCEIISVSSTHHPRAAITRPDCPAFDIEKSDAVGLPKSDAIRLEDFSWRFSESHGKHIHFDQLFKRATRKEGFDQGIVFSQFPILPNIVYHVSFSIRPSIQRYIFYSVGLGADRQSRLYQIQQRICSFRLDQMPIFHT